MTRVKRRSRTMKIASILVTLLSTGTMAQAAEPTPPRDYTPPGFVRQPSLVSNAGLVNKNEWAVVVSLDAQVLPPAVMVGARYGLLYWWEVGLEVGGDYGVFQALLHTKLENFKTRRSERFFWGFTFDTGYKVHTADLGQKLYFDDQSWVFILENTFALRFGQRRDKAFFLTTQFYVDLDQHQPRRQTDYYIAPAEVGFETVVGAFGNFFIQAGAAYSINGMQTERGLLYDRTWFPTLALGFAYRSGERTAIYYARETRHLAHR